MWNLRLHFVNGQYKKIPFLITSLKCVMGRYLLFISYIGTGFSGMQVQSKQPVKTVVGVIKKAMCASLRLASEPVVVTSSRTDRGVHALCSTVHADLHHQRNEDEIDVDVITASLNKTFCDFEEEIKVLKTLRVCDNFHSRYLLKRRTYVYRVCVPRQFHLEWAFPYPPYEQYRSWLIREPLDMDLVHKAVSVLSGTHDFKAFTTSSGLEDKPPDYSTVRNVEISLEPGTSFMSPYMPPFTDQFDYWHFVYKSRSFLYRQVRRMTGVIVAAGRGVISLDHVTRLITDPDNTTIGRPDVNICPSHGLYLANVEYEDKDLVYLPSSETCSQVTESRAAVDSDEQTAASL